MALKMDDFLTVYKELEKSLREDETTVLDFESTLSAEEADKLRICRQIRNYVQHHPDNFLMPTTHMIDFVKKVISEVEAKKEKVKDRTSKIKPVCETDKLEDVINFFNKQKKYNIAPVVDKEWLLVGVITINNLIYSLAMNSVKKKIKDTKCVTKASVVASPNDDLADYTMGEFIVVTKEEKYMGVVKW